MVGSAEGASARDEGVAARAADVEAARGSMDAGPASADWALSVVGRLFRLAPRLMDLLDLGAREYGMGFARGRVLGLEADGWVTRSPHQEDRRVTIISLTAAAEAALAGLRENYEALAHDLIGDVSPDDLRQCLTVITTVHDRLDDVVASRKAAFGSPPGPGPVPVPGPGPQA
jgi:hypothetical protein